MNEKQSRCRGEGAQTRAHEQKQSGRRQMQRRGQAEAGAHKPRTRPSDETREPLKYNQADGGSRSFRECGLVLAR